MPSTQEPHPDYCSDRVDGFTQSSCKKPEITCAKSRTNGSRTQVTRTLPSCSAGTPSRMALRSMPFKKASSSKDTWSMVLLVDRGVLRRPSLSGTPTVTFWSVHIHNGVAKKRDASTDLLRRLRAHMTQHNVDFIGADFNMSAFSTVGDVFTDPEFSDPGNSLLWARLKNGCFWT